MVLNQLEIRYVKKPLSLQTAWKDEGHVKDTRHIRVGQHVFHHDVFY